MPFFAGKIRNEHTIKLQIKEYLHVFLPTPECVCKFWSGFYKLKKMWDRMHTAAKRQFWEQEQLLFCCSYWQPLTWGNIMRQGMKERAKQSRNGVKQGLWMNNPRKPDSRQKEDKTLHTFSIFFPSLIRKGKKASGSWERKKATNSLFLKLWFLKCIFCHCLLKIPFISLNFQMQGKYWCS